MAMENALAPTNNKAVPTNIITTIDLTSIPILQAPDIYSPVETTPSDSDAIKNSPLSTDSSLSLPSGASSEKKKRIFENQSFDSSLSLKNEPFSFENNDIQNEGFHDLIEDNANDEYSADDNDYDVDVLVESMENRVEGEGAVSDETMVSASSNEDNYDKINADSLSDKISININALTTVPVTQPPPSPSISLEEKLSKLFLEASILSSDLSQLRAMLQDLDDSQAKELREVQ